MPQPPLPIVLLGGPIRDWDVRWDEVGTHLAIWIADASDTTVGDLTLHTFDRATERLDESGPLLVDQPALAGFSIGSGRLAWASPPGQGGQGSHVEVLAWSGGATGQASSEPDPGTSPVLVIR